MNDDQLLRYSRHILLDELGIEGQEKLLAGHALVIGAGGLGAAALPYLASAGVGHLTIVVDDDVDVSNLDQLMWAMLSRYDPATSVDVLRRMRSTPADPRLTPEQRKVRDFTNSRMVIDATRPYEWRDKFPKVNAPSQEVVREAREKFGYLLK